MISIPSNIFDIYNEAVDNIWSKTITLVYPEVKQPCPNCLNDGTRSNGVYRTGGPYPFENGFICPLCNGDGFKLIESTDKIKARLYYNRKDWIDIGIPVNVPYQAAQMVCKLDDLPKIQRCKYIIPEYYDGIQGYQIQNLTLAGAYYPQGFTQNPTKYVVTFWVANA